MRASVWAAAGVLVVATVVRTSGADPAHGRTPQAPRLLSETGLLVPGTATVDSRNRAYSPQYPLWTDGALKARWIRLPDGATIDARDDEHWSFPVGTKFWKEFSFGGRRVETRFLWRARADTWVFASYVWNGDQSDAVLAPAAGVRQAADIGDGKRHSIPSIEDCRSCHESGNVLGFNALQLSTDRDPLAPHAEILAPEMVTVKTLVDEQRLQPARPDLVARPPRIDAPSSVARAALGYLSMNCGICHHEGAPIDTRLRLRPARGQSTADLLALLRTAPTSWEIPAVESGSTRFVVPQHPEFSSLVARMKSRRPSTQMPPLGTVTVDQDGVSLIQRWIQGLAADELK